MLRFVLLALMADGRPVHGYALMKAFAARSGVRVSIGNVYRELQRLAAERHIAPAANPAGADARRAPYVITPAGRQALAAWSTTPAEVFVRHTPDPLVYRLALLADMPAADARTLLDELQAEIAAALKGVERERAARQGGEAGAATRTALLGRRTRHLAADLELVAALRDALAAAPPSRGRRARR
jgi:DNA-binding PadR family transcriptional regulator